MERLKYIWGWFTFTWEDGGANAIAKDKKTCIYSIGQRIPVEFVLLCDHAGTWGNCCLNSTINDSKKLNQIITTYIHIYIYI